MSDRYLLECPGCGYRAPVGTTLAGQELKCRKCGKSIAVPSLRDLRRLPRADEQGLGERSRAREPETARGTGEMRPRARPVRGWMFLLGAVLLLVGGGVAARSFVTAAHLPTTRPSLEMDADTERQLQRAGPVDIQRIWLDVIRREPGEWVESGLHELRRVARARRLIGTVLSVLAVAGLGLVIGSFFGPRSRRSRAPRRS